MQCGKFEWRDWFDSFDLELHGDSFGRVKEREREVRIREECEIYERCRAKFRKLGGLNLHPWICIR